MESIWTVSLITLWVVVLLNLLLTLRIVRWLRATRDLQEHMAEQESIPELSIGTPAPDFSVKTLSGTSLRVANYAGQAVAFIFVSPHCGACRRKVFLLEKLRTLAKERSGVELVLVSDSSTVETYTWINAIREEDGVEVTLPVLVAPRRSSDFLKTYNPRGITPYFCLINEQGIVQARDPLGMGEWPKLQREWEGPTTSRPFSRRYT